MEKQADIDIYDNDIADKVCDAISISRGSLQEILEENGINITTRTVYNWLRKNEGFRAAYEAARQYQAELYFEEMLRIAYDATSDLMPDGKGGHIVNTAAVQRARVIIDTLKFAMSKLYPKRYGDTIYHKLAEIEQKLTLFEGKDVKK